MGTNCLVKSITSQVDAALSEVNKEYLKAQSQLDRKILEASKARSLLDFPSAQKLLSDATKFLSSEINGLVDEAGNTITSAMNLAASSVLTVVAAVAASVGNQLKAVVYGSIIEALKNELRVRILYYRLLDFHLSSLQMVLFAMQSNKPTNLYRLRIAYGYIERAQRQLHAFVQAHNPISTGLGKPPVPLRSQKGILTQAFNNIASAESILKGDIAASKALLQSKSVKDFNKILMETFEREVLAQSMYMFETIAWNLARLASMIPIPFSGLVYTKGSLSIPGVVRAKTFSATLQDTLLNREKTNTQKSLNTTIAAIDFAKGMIPTNILATQLMNQLLTFDVDWADLKGVADVLITLTSPAVSMIDTLKGEMQAALENRDSEIILMGKEAKWLIQMNLLDAFKQTFFGAIQNTSILETNLSIMNKIWVKIDKYQQNPVDSKIVNSLGKVLTTLPQAPFNNRAMVESRALCVGLKKLVGRGITDNTNLLNTLALWDPSATLAASKAFGQLLAAMKNLPPPASTIAEGLATGQIGAVAAGLSSIIALGGTLLDNIKKLGSSCDDSGPDDALIAEVNVPEYERRVLA